MRVLRSLALAAMLLSPASFAQSANAPANEDLKAPDNKPPEIKETRPSPPKIDPQAFDTEPPEAAESSVWSLLRMLAALGVVLGLVYISLNWGLRRLMGARAPGFGGASVVKVVERIPLDPKTSLFVIKAAGEYLLIGRGEQGLSTLSKLDSVEVERIEREKSVPGAPLSPFLQKLLSRRGGPPPPTA